MKKLTFIKNLILIGVLLLPARAFGFTEPSNSQYSCQPIFQVNAVPPNILIILDNSGSMNFQAYSGNYDHNTKYYGYFEPDKKYSYGSNVFTRDTTGAWDGNFLNWLTMRRIDVTRKVLMGGKATSRTGGGNQTNIGEAPAQSGRDYYKTYNDNTHNVTPFSAGNKSYHVDAGNFYVDSNTYVIKVKKDITLSDEASNFVDGNLAGVLQKIGSKARWGNEFFNYGTGTNKSGGYIASTIGTNMTSLITDLQNTGCDTWTPLAEAYYVAVQYFKQEDVQSGLDYPNNVIPNANVGQDPYYNGTEFVHCAKGFVILLTDGASTKDMMIPDFLKDYDNDGNDPGTYPSSGSDYLDDIALYARTTDLRSSTVGKTELDGDQNLILYTIYAFGTDPDAEHLLEDAAKNGGFVEKDGIFGPSSTSEWDADSDGVPDTYYKADDGYKLESKLLQAINDILERAASGTAVSVLATSGEGEGGLVQAFFRPQITSGLTDIKWLGYLQSLWVDSFGNLREDTNSNHALDIGTDKVITYFVDTSSGDTKIKRFAVSSSDPYPDVENDPYETMELDEIKAVWQAGNLLAERSAADRKIFTYIDKNDDDVVDESTDNPFDDSGEVVRFHTGSSAAIKPYLGVYDDSTWEYLAGTLTNNHDNRVSNLIQYIRGNDISGLRTRTFDYDDDGTDETWKLGDIIHSTPVAISRPPDNFHVIYGDQSYNDFYNSFKNRETVVYVGANDGMLHAFTSWKYDSSSLQYTDPYPSDGSGDSTYIPSEKIGDELWAYIPQSLLPHLKWLPAADYSHVFYVDMKPKIFDAKILDDETHYSDSDTEKNWGTFLLTGLNLGGGYIQAKEDFNGDGDNTDAGDLRDFYPSYVLLDVTEPRNPRLLWERSYADLQASASTPAVLRVKDKWFAVFGSGPSSCTGESSQTGKIYVVDLATGDPYPSGSGDDWRFKTSESNAFMNSPVSIDKGLNYNVDAIYVGGTYFASNTWKGKVYKITVPWADSSSNYDGINLANYSDDPNDATNPWQFSELFNALRPVTGPLALSVDFNEKVWIYGGTGRYLSQDDKTNTDTQYFFGIKDPFFNSKYEADYYHKYPGVPKTLIHSDLLDVDGIVVIDKGNVLKDGSTYGTFDNLLTNARAKDGWIREMMIGGERMLVKPTLLGGIVFAPSFVPNSDVCGFGGDSYLYGVYFETGTAYYKKVFSTDETIGYVADKISLGAGKAASLGIHVGSEEGAKGFIQLSTGEILSEGLSPAFEIKSGLTSWQER